MALLDLSENLNLFKPLPHDLDLTDKIMGGGVYGSVDGSLAVIDIAYLNMPAYLNRVNEFMRWAGNALKHNDYYKGD